MNNIELSLLMGLWPIIYFLIYQMMHQPGQRVKTVALQRRGEIIAVGPTHTLIEFDDGSTALYRNSLFEVE
jgi:hypothetical protein